MEVLYSCRLILVDGRPTPAPVVGVAAFDVVGWNFSNSRE